MASTTLFLKFAGTLVLLFYSDLCGIARAAEYAQPVSKNASSNRNKGTDEQLRMLEVLPLAELKRAALRVNRIEVDLVGRWDRELENRAYVPVIDFDVGLREQGSWQANEEEQELVLRTPELGSS